MESPGKHGYSLFPETGRPIPRDGEVCRGAFLASHVLNEKIWCLHEHSKGEYRTVIFGIAKESQFVDFSDCGHHIVRHLFPSLCRSRHDLYRSGGGFQGTAARSVGTSDNRILRQLPPFVRAIRSAGLSAQAYVNGHEW